MRRLSTIATPMLSGGRMPSVDERAIVSTEPGGPLGDGATLSLADGGDPDADAAAEALAEALDDGATDSAGEPLEQPARTNATIAVSTFTLVIPRS
jgi:hypothetical protein